MKTEFEDQPAICHYLNKQWLPLREQWAHCYTKKYRNFGYKATSPVESTNLTTKSYLLNSRSDLFRLVKTLHEMHMNQRKEFFEVTSYQNTKTKREYLNRTWLGPLSTAVSYKGLDLINNEYRYALAALPVEEGHQSTRQITDLPPCDDNTCTVGLQFGIPCRHKIYQLLVGNRTKEEAEKETLHVRDVHPHWHLALPLYVEDSYLRIKDPKMAIPKGRPKNHPAPPLTKGLPIPTADTPRRRSTPKTPSQQPRLKRTRPGPPQGSAPRMSDSIRRRLSQWELEGDEADEAPQERTRLVIASRPRAGRLLSSGGPRQSTQEPLFRSLAAPEAQQAPETPASMEAPALMEAAAPAPKRRGRPPKNTTTAPERGLQTALPQPKKRGRPPKNKEAAVPEPKRQRATPGGGPPAATIGVGIASQRLVGTQVAVDGTGQTTRSGRHVKLTKKAAEAGTA